MHLFLNHVPELHPYSPLVRVQLLNLALKQMSSIEKVGFNLLKLLVMVPAFIGLAQLPPWFALGGLIVLLLLLSFLARPLQIWFAQKHWLKAIQLYQQEQEQDE